MDKAEEFTFKQRVEELVKAMKRRATEARKAELERLMELLKSE